MEIGLIVLVNNVKYIFCWQELFLLILIDIKNFFKFIYIYKVFVVDVIFVFYFFDEQILQIEIDFIGFYDLDVGLVFLCRLVFFCFRLFGK